MRLMKSLRHEVPKVDALRARPGMARVLAVGAFADQVKHLGKVVLVRALAEPLVKSGYGAYLLKALAKDR